MSENTKKIRSYLVVSEKSCNFAAQNFNRVYIVMATAQDIMRKGQWICLTNQLSAASGVLHRVQEGYAMTLRLR